MVLVEKTMQDQANLIEPYAFKFIEGYVETEKSIPAKITSQTIRPPLVIDEEKKPWYKRILGV